MNSADLDIYQNDDAVVIENSDTDLEDTIDLNQELKNINKGQDKDE